jgi:uncharacterized membrane protein
MFLSFVTAAAVSATTLLSPVAVPAACAWQVTPVTTPSGSKPANVVVTGTDGHGDYSGYELLGGQDTRFILWNQGQPEIQPSAGDTTLPVDQNSSGTVLLTAFVNGQRQIFTFDGSHTGSGAFTPVRLPAGYDSASATAINDRGDIVGSARRTADRHSVAILWSTLSTGSGPTVIDSPDDTWTGAVDVDEDGTVLLGGGYKVLLWKNGQVTPLSLTPSIPRALRGGTAVGLDLRADGTHGILWNGPKDPRYLDASTTAEDINAHGLIAGENTAGTAAAWQGTQSLGALPLPPRATSATAGVVGDDGTILGAAGDAGPVAWRCAVR